MLIDKNSDSIIKNIKNKSKLLNVTVLLIITVLLFVNIRVVFSILDYIPLFSAAIMLSSATGLVLAGLFISRKISFDAINNLIKEINNRREAEENIKKANEELESRVEERTGELSNAVNILNESLAEQKKLEEKLYNTSITDELTGILNRRGFFTLTEHRLKLAKRQKIGLLLLYADLDNLKGINDTYGHEEGDKLLNDASNILKSTFREADIVARIGGDEFVVFPVGTTNDHIEIISSRLKKNIDAFNSKSTKSYKLSLSIGISAYDPLALQTIDRLLSEADKLMYEQKMRKKGLT
jgi:diguanylate cyclase (GGDEF)-like protein